ncbi:MAG: hypothetical protein IJB86_01095 [Clostridia bacterium]|nr:hypothetical protein [Clostridia bacterium]
MKQSGFGGKTPYDNRNYEISDELTPDPFSEEPQPIRIRVSRSEMKTTIGRRSKLRKDSNNTNN